MGNRALFLRPPDRRTIDRFLASQGDAAFSYPEVGRSAGAFPPGYAHDRSRVRLGHGEEVFDVARDALRRWAMYPPAWTRIEPRDAPIRAGTVVAVLARSRGLWMLNACRIVYEIREGGPLRRFGFAYGTLAAHVESGEERFLVEQREDGSVWYELSSFSRPARWFTTLAYPLVRREQRRFARDSLAAMQAAVAERGR